MCPASKEAAGKLHQLPLGPDGRRMEHQRELERESKALSERVSGGQETVLRTAESAGINPTGY